MNNETRQLLERLLNNIERYQVKRQDHDTFADEIKGIEAELAKPEQEPITFSAPSYSYEVMGCGLEDRGINDRYEAMRYGWDCAIDKFITQIPDELLYTSPQSHKPMKESDLDDIYVDVLGINALDDTECKIVLKIV